MTISRLKKKLAKLTETHGITLDNDTASDIKAIMDAEEHRVKKDHGEGSFLRLFWQTQKEAASGPACGRRWHPMIIKWCIYLRHQSSKAYDTLRHTLALPSQRTLRDYTSCVKASAGTLGVLSASATSVRSAITCCNSSVLSKVILHVAILKLWPTR